MQPSITGRLILWLSLCSLLVIGSGLYIDYRLSRGEILERVALQTKDTIDRAVTDLENMLDGVEANTLILGRVLEQREYSEAGLEQIVKAAIETNPDLFGAAIAVHPDFTDRPRGFAPFFFRDQGVPTVAELTRGDTPYWQRPWFTGAADSAGPIWSEPYFDAEGAQELMTTFSVPVYRSNAEGQAQLYAVITADVALWEFQDYLERLRLGDSSFGILLSRTGTVLGSGNPDHLMRHYRDLVSPSEQPRWTQMLDAAANGQVAEHELSCLSGDGRCTLHLGALQSTGWPVGVVYSQQELLSPLHAFQLKTLGVSLLTLAVVVLAVFAVGRRLTRPLVALADATEDVARGELNTPLPRHGSQDEVGRLIGAFGSMTRNLKRYIADLEQATASRSRLEGELAAARDIQMSMLPQGGQASEAAANLSIWARVEPAKSVGGDFYRYSLTAKGLELAVGDVSDKGVPAALFMARTVSLLPASGESAAQAELGMAAVNNALEEGNSSCMFVTALLASLDSARAELVFTSAGHPAPVLVRAGRASPLTQDSGPALGLARDQHFTINHWPLDPGDRLAFYTDGVDEAFSADGQMFSLDRLLDNLSRSARLSPDAAGQLLFDELAEHARGVSQSDDITLVIVDYHPAAAEATDDRARTSLAQGAGLAPRALDWIQARLGAANIDGGTASEIVLIAEEVITNIDKYAGLDTGDEVELALDLSADRVELSVADPGAPYDPLTETSGAELGQSISEADIGGLGVHLIRQLSDEQHYHHAEGRNHLRIVKRLPGPD
ncbi:MAG: SpoIIE family protein phosphatase [Pseudomonadota bacterium]